jgi:hypothetical protein
VRAISLSIRFNVLRKKSTHQPSMAATIATTTTNMQQNDDDNGIGNDNDDINQS